MVNSLLVLYQYYWDRKSKEEKIIPIIHLALAWRSFTKYTVYTCSIKHSAATTHHKNEIVAFGENKWEKWEKIRGAFLPSTHTWPSSQWHRVIKFAIRSNCCVHFLSSELCSLDDVQFLGALFSYFFILAQHFLPRCHDALQYTPFYGIIDVVSHFMLVLCLARPLPRITIAFTHTHAWSSVCEWALGT